MADFAQQISDETEEKRRLRKIYFSAFKLKQSEKMQAAFGKQKLFTKLEIFESEKAKLNLCKRIC